MSILRGSLASLLGFFVVLPVRAQTVQLPETVVIATTPSPILRQPSDGASAPPPGSETQTPLQGTLPVVTDQFATVTVVPNEEIRRNPGNTLGDLLFAKPGITGSSFAPGASSRPVIRGLDMNRVGILENGIGSSGASDLGEDHFVPIDPLATNQIEVIRGPATLRYGSQSIGGVVSASNNRIPSVIPSRGVVTELRGNLSSVDNGLNGAVLLDAGHGNFAFHADAFDRNAGDYGIPSNPYRFDPTRPFNGKQPNSSVRSDGASVGGSYIFDRGFFGVAVSQTNSLYHIPGIDGEDHKTRIDARQTKVNSKGELRPDSSAIEAIRFWLGATDYKHSEIGLADPLDPATDGVRQQFTNKEQEGRVEVQLAPVNLSFAALTTALGVQAGHQLLTAPSPDNPGLYDPNKNTRVAGYFFNEFKFTETLKAQVAGRIERVKLFGMTPLFPGDFLPDGNPLVGTQRSPEFTPKSVSFGMIKNLPWDLAASITAQRVERAPKPAELFSRGAHDATGTFDIGNPNLNIEVARSIEVGLRRATGPFRFEATAYLTRFNNFIYRRLTGAMCDATFDTCGVPGGGLKQTVYSQRDAIFRGGEFQSQWDIAPLWAGVFGLESQFDLVRATFTDGTNVPRIPPMRVGGGVFYRDGNWLARVNLLHAFAQNNITDVETSTPDYNLLKAEISYTRKIKEAGIPIYEITLGMTGDNLLNDDIRNSVSFTKDEVLLPGRNVRLFANVRF
jgi:iron complex outermembrane recepter protein